MTFETEFKPHFSIDKDYRTNAPTYYDYMAEVKEAMDTLYSDVSEAVDYDLVRSLRADGVLLQMTKTEVSPKRFEYTLSVKSDDGKENVIYNDDGTIAIKKENGKTLVRAMPTEVLTKLHIQEGEGVKVERSTNTFTIKLDFNVAQRKMKSSNTVTINDTDNTANVNFDTVQQKLQAGDNIEIKGQIIRAVGDANSAYKQDKITKFTNSALMGSELYGLQAEGKVVTTNIGYLRKSGTYFINGDNSHTTTASGARKGSIDTPTWERGWLIVHSAEGTDSCIQEFIPWHGYGRYYRTGSLITLDQRIEHYDKKYLELGELGDYYYWSPWQTVVSVNLEDTALKTKTDNVTIKDLYKGGFSGATQENVLKGNPNVRAGKLYSKNGLYLNDSYMGYITVQSLTQRANLTFLPQSAYGNTLTPYASYGIKPGTSICYLLNWGNGKNYVTAYDMLRSVAIKETELVYNGNQTPINWVRSSANIFVGRKETFIVGTRVHQFWKWNETTNSLRGAMGTTPVTWNKKVENGSTTFLVGVSGDPENDDYIYIMTEDRKALGGDPYKIATNAGDAIRVYKVDYTADSNNPTITQVFGVTKPGNYFGGFCYHNGVFYIDYMDSDGSDTGVKLGKCYIYNATGELLDTLQFTGNTADSGIATYDGKGTYMNGCSIIQVPRTANEYSSRNTPADGLAREYETWVTHSFFKEGLGQMIGRHPAYGSEQYQKDITINKAIEDGVETHTNGTTEYVVWKDPDNVEENTDEVPNISDSGISTMEE